MKKIILLTAAVCSACTVCASAHTAQDVSIAAIGENKSTIYSLLGEPDSSAANGAKDVYRLEDGNTAILQYNNGFLERAYIVREY
ncbi:MAG: hypothetical protein Q4G33_06695 [bacterium]|nr:hypothetical protein [bacterium]